MHALVAAVLADTSTEVKAKNPILPAGKEIIWAALSFVILLFLLWKYAWPGIQKGMQARTDRIRQNLDDAERSKGEADSILAQYQRQLADAKTEAARIIEEARQAADKVRQDLRHQAETEVAGLKARAAEDIQAQAERAMADLRRQVREFSIELAEKVVGANLDRDRNLALVDNFIEQVGSQN